MLFVKNQNTIKAIEPTFLTKYNNNFQVYTKRFTIISFSKNINNSIHRFLKNAICKRSSNGNYSNAPGLLCRTVLHKQDLRKYVNNFKARGQTFANKQLNTCNVLFRNPVCLIPIATDITKKILFGRRYDKPLFIYSRFIGITIQ